MKSNLSASLCSSYLVECRQIVTVGTGIVVSTAHQVPLQRAVDGCAFQGDLSLVIHLDDRHRHVASARCKLRLHKLARQAIVHCVCPGFVTRHIVLAHGT